jgi:hypothetical protein
MKQKTAMALLIDDLKENNRHHYEANIDWFNKLLAIERQQIEDAYDMGASDAETRFPNFTDGEDYAKNFTQD